MDDLVSALNRFKGSNVVVVGDLMLDLYTIGSVDRISPEAPIPVLKKESEVALPGGAGNVARNFVMLGANVELLGFVGSDEPGKSLLSLLRKSGVSCEGVIKIKGRATTVKSRFQSGGQQILRLDEEETREFLDNDYKKLEQEFKKALEKADIVVFSEYGKGVFAKKITSSLIAYAKRKKKLIVADLKPRSAALFKGADIVTPNLKEGREITGIDEVMGVGTKLVSDYGWKVVLTLGSSGMSVFNGKKVTHIEGKKVQVFDVSGAGDSVIAVLSLGLVSGLSLEKAAELANMAGGLVVQKRYTATVGVDELLDLFRSESHWDYAKLVPKLWGYEKWLENNDKYCCKILGLNKGYQCSLHYHKIKDETFLITKGHVKMEVEGKVIFLKEGNYIRIAPGAKHRFGGIEDSTIMEISTHHEESDSYRVEESRKMD